MDMISPVMVQAVAQLICAIAALIKAIWPKGVRR